MDSGALCVMTVSETLRHLLCAGLSVIQAVLQLLSLAAELIQSC